MPASAALAIRSASAFQAGRSASAGEVGQAGELEGDADSHDAAGCVALAVDAHGADREDADVLLPAAELAAGEPLAIELQDDIAAAGVGFDAHGVLGVGMGSAARGCEGVRPGRGLV
jgi:hypothetical protein